MKKYIITGLAAILAATSGAFAGETSYKKTVIPVEEPCVFRDQEFQLDLFGQGAFYDH